MPNRLDDKTVVRHFYCGICGERHMETTDMKSLDSDFFDLTLPSKEIVEFEEDGETVEKEVYMKARFRTVCNSCYSAIATLVELRKDLINKKQEARA